jgi:hypothetical protein
MTFIMLVEFIQFVYYNTHAVQKFIKKLLYNYFCAEYLKRNPNEEWILQVDRPVCIT